MARASSAAVGGRCCAVAALLKCALFLLMLVAGVAVPALVGGPDGETKHHLSLESTKRSSFTGMLAPEMLTRYTSGCGI